MTSQDSAPNALYTSFGDQETKLLELESQLVSAISFDYNYIFDILSVISSKDLKDEIVLKNIESVKILTAGELTSKMISTDLKSSNIILNFDLNQIDVHLGVSYRNRLVRNMAEANLKNYINTTNITTLNQITAQFSMFVKEFMTNVEIRKFPSTWEVRYLLFVQFRLQMKDVIMKCLTQPLFGTKEGISTAMQTILVVKNFENKIGDILKENNSNCELSIEDSLINLFESCLIWFLNDVKNEMSIFVATKTEAIMATTWLVPDIKTESATPITLLGPDTTTAEMFAFFKTIFDKSNRYSTGKIFANLVNEALNQIKIHITALGTKYPKDRKTFDTNLEYMLFNIICTTGYCIDTVENMKTTLESKVQKRYFASINFNSAKDVLHDVLTSTIDTLVSETMQRYQSDFAKLSVFKFDEKSTAASPKLITDYITMICRKYSGVVTRADKYLNPFCAVMITKKLTFCTIDTVLEQLLKLRNIHWTHSSAFDIIVATLFQTTNDLMEQKLIDEHNIVGVTSDKITITLRSKISGKITRIQNCINAIAVENSVYDDERHATYFTNEKISFDTMTGVKGIITYKNVGKVAMTSMGDVAVGGINSTTNAFSVNNFKKLVGKGNNDVAVSDISNHSTYSDGVAGPGTGTHAFTSFISGTKKIFTEGLFTDGIEIGQKKSEKAITVNNKDSVDSKKKAIIIEKKS